MPSQATASLHEQMHSLLGGYRTTQMLFVATRLGLPDLMAFGPRTPSDLATATATLEQPLFRLLRALASIGVFAELPDGRFELTPLAATLRSDADSSLRAFALSYGEAWWWRGFGELLHSVKTGETGFSRAHGLELFDFLRGHPEHARAFNDNMSAMTRDEAAAILDAFDFSGIPLLVDVGGGHGAFASAVLGRHPGVRAIVFDQASVVDAKPAAAATPELLDRLEFVGGSFFERVPSGGDAYCLKDILHDWDDDRCVQILTTIRQAMPDAARLLVVERVIPPGNGAFPGKLIDMTMLVMTGGRERTAAEYEALLRSAGLRLVRITPTASGSSVLEAAIAGDDPGPRQATLGRQR